MANVVDEGRSWTTSELRRAIWLGYGGISPRRPATPQVAAEIGVSVRSLQRWLSGRSHPSPQHAAALRAALAPPVDVLARQAQDRKHAIAAVRELARTRYRPASKQWRTLGWHQPHDLRLLHHERLGILRTVVGLAAPAKPFVIPAGWTEREVTHFPNRPAAVVAKHEILDRVAPWRIRARADLVADGRHEVWLDVAPAGEPVVETQATPPL